MNDLKKEIGKRLREIRLVFLDGAKVSASQFAEALGETKDNIANYENGRANAPNRLLLSLYKRGFNPAYILSGEGSMFADNEKGRELKKIVESKKKGKKEKEKDIDYSKISVLELEKKIEQYQIAAGDLMKILEKIKKERAENERQT